MHSNEIEAKEQTKRNYAWASCITIIILSLALFMVKCCALSESGYTERVKAVCQGDLKLDGAKSAACMKVLNSSM